MLFIESTVFTRSLSNYITDEGYRELQARLILNPPSGQVIPGCGGLRKIRHGDPRRGKGRRGGLRIIYLHVPELNWIFLLDIYGKDEKDDLTAEEKKELARLANRIKEEARARSRRGR
jgi:mRNA-degrading endonuclease RelE of RelBE toxin-antitoxin system